MTAKMDSRSATCDIELASPHPPKVGSQVANERGISNGFFDRLSMIAIAMSGASIEDTLPLFYNQLTCGCRACPRFVLAAIIADIDSPDVMITKPGMQISFAQSPTLERLRRQLRGMDNNVPAWPFSRLLMRYRRD
jgi:hypothetical protein